MSETSNAPQLLSTAAAAQALGVDRSTLARWAMSGAVTPARRTVGGHMRWDLDRLREQLDEAGTTGLAAE